jgi:hypothetical protein
MHHEDPFGASNTMNDLDYDQQFSGLTFLWVDESVL